jgi:hypothetical protein
MPAADDDLAVDETPGYKGPGQLKSADELAKLDYVRRLDLADDGDGETDTLGARRGTTR